MKSALRFAVATLALGAAAPFNIDGVVAARSGSVAGKFFDLNRVEVLKGPQGALYGRNASGGAVKRLTKKPELGEFGGCFRIGGGDYNAMSSEGALNIPAADKLALRAGYQIVHRVGLRRTLFPTSARRPMCSGTLVSEEYHLETG